RRRVRPILLMLVSNAAEIALSLQPSPASDTSAFSRMRAFVSDCAGCLPAQSIASSCSRSFALSFTTYFLTEISLPATNHLHRRIAASPRQRFRKTPQIQRLWRLAQLAQFGGGFCNFVRGGMNRIKGLAG